jgi:hypothetical protein
MMLRQALAAGILGTMLAIVPAMAQQERPAPPQTEAALAVFPSIRRTATGSGPSWRLRPSTVKFWPYGRSW